MDADARSAAGDGAGPEVSAASKARALYVALRQLVANDAWSVERCPMGGLGGLPSGNRIHLWWFNGDLTGFNGI